MLVDRLQSLLRPPRFGKSPFQKLGKRFDFLQPLVLLPEPGLEP